MVGILAATALHGRSPSDAATAKSGAASGPRLVVADGPSTTTPWPTPGYTEEELRPVVDAFVQLATGGSPAPSVAPPDPAPSSSPSPPTTGPGRVEAGAGSTRSPEPSAARSSARWVVLLVVVLALGGAAVVARNRLRSRGPHVRGRPRRPDRPDAEVDDGTAALDTPTAPLGVDQRVDLALRHAWSALAGAGRGERPTVLAVRVGEIGVEVLLDSPIRDAPGLFVASDDGRSWTLGADVADDELRRDGEDEPAPLPALLTVGTTPEGPVLIDLIHAGTLSVEGEAGRVAGFVDGAALELATAPWAERAVLGLAGGDDRLAALANVVALASPRGAVDGPPAALERSVVEFLHARSANAVALVVAPGAASPEDVDAVATARASHQGRVGLVAPGPVGDATWRLVIGAGGQGVLHPLGVELECVVDSQAVAATVQALTLRVDGQPAEAEDRSVETPPATPQVLVLGPVVVHWPDLLPGRRPSRRKLEEVVVYLATHPERPVPADRLRTGVWPLTDDERAGEVADSTFRATMSRARAALGVDGDGRPYLPEARDGCYALDPSVGCDWVEFSRLSRRARSAPAPEAASLLRAGLEHVRGVPFADVPRGCYGWAWTEQLVSAIEVAVADAAERLAELALDAGDFATARWAAAKGLLVVPSRESLYRLRMRAAFEAGDVDDVEQAYVEVRRAARAVDEAEEPQTQTTALYERLRRATRAGFEDIEATARLAGVR